MTSLALSRTPEGFTVPTRAITGSQLRAARARARLHNKEMAALLGVSTRTLNNWLDTGVPARAEDDVAERLAPYLTPGEGTSADTVRLHSCSDVELLAEVWRRMDAYKHPAHDDDLDDEPEPPRPAPHGLPSTRTSGEISGKTAGRPTRFTPPTSLQP